ncbi:DUF6443 domain-containing protein [Chryseobacterium flavum]|uniref:DUF6443 domain-containing protein n=1 Tax=Chryseobacterium flavum TaxID=415851 RepID=UPI0028AF318F|nr:DUF6443 domain-containing protein [Chryseobacterium flavum]
MKKHLLFIIVFLCSYLSTEAQSLTQSENYVYSRTYLEPVTASSSTAKQVQEVTYIDGLGRPKQNISIKSTPSGKDLVTPVEYDAFGRLIKNMLPLPQQATANGAIFTSPDASGAAGVYGTAANYYGERKIENSPLERLLEQAAPGDAWKMGSGKTIKYAYESNLASEVKKFVVNTTWTTVSGVAVGTPALSISAENTVYASGGFYKAGTLYKDTVTDEDGNTVVKFTNSKDQVVLIRKNDGTQNIDTYYVYNEYGQQAFVLSPLAVKAIETAGNVISAATLDNLCYQYRYDNQDRLVEKKFPGKGWELLIYDKADRLVMTQDANLKASAQWMFIKYDRFGRVAYTGIANNTGSRAALQAVVNANTNLNETRTTTPGVTLNGMAVYYSKVTAPTSIAQVLSVNYYDEYPPESPAKPDAILGQNTLAQVPSSLTVNGTTTSRSIKGLPTAAFARNIEDSQWTRDYFWYDTMGRQVGTHSVNHLGGYTRTETELDFSGLPKLANTYHRRKETEVGVVIKERFEYDLQNRLKKHWHQVDDQPEQLLAENTYNEISQLINKKVGNNLQSIDYAYNIRGWLTDVNKGQMALADMGGKLFSYKIKYNQKNGIDNPDAVQFPGKNVKPKFNGNIAEVDWRAVETVGVNPSLTPKRYGYAYDSLNRLSAGYYQNPNNPNSKENTESLAYDLNGNIKTLYRTSVIEGSGTTATVIDNLEYFYTGNLLASVKDYTGNRTGYEGGGNPIIYDGNGNMKTMMDKKITGVTYNFMNLPNSVTIGADNDHTQINTKYRADGTKLRKESIKTTVGVVNTVTRTETSDYLDGFQYLKVISSGDGSSEMFAVQETDYAMEQQAFTIGGGIPVVTDPTIDPPFNPGPILALKTEDLRFFSTGEGFYDYQKDQYIYQYKDHLGNVRVSFGRNSTGALEIVDANDYYPFGMNHLKTGGSYFGAGSFKNYKFLSQELQESGLYDLNARFYMADLGRFGAHDPLSNKTFDPYGYAYSNPILFADPTGLEGEPVPGGSGPGGPAAIGTASSPIKIQEVVVGSPMRAVTANTVSVLPSNCLVCNSGISAPRLENKSVPTVPKPKEENWYSIGGKSNWFLGNIAITTSFKGLMNSQKMYSQGMRKGVFGNYQLTGRNLSLFGKAAMNDATIPVSQLGKIGKGLGTGSFYLGVLIDMAGVVTGDVEVGKVALNTGFGAMGNWGGPIGASIGTIYFGVDNFYDGPQGQGWPGFFNGANDFQSGLDQGFNNAGPYRMNIMGAHEPK